MSRRLFPWLMVALLIVSNVLIIHQLHQAAYLTVQQDAVVVRERPDTEAEAVDSLIKSQTVPILSQSKDWYLIQVNDTKGWVPAWLIDNDSLKSDQNVFVETYKQTPVYAEPNLSASRITNLDSGDYYLLERESKGWSQIQWEGQTGYIPSDQIRMVDASKTPRHKQQLPENTELGDESTVIMRKSNQSFLKEPSREAELIYTPELSQRFEYVETVEDPYGNEYYYVKDDDGTYGYVETFGVARGSDSNQHVGQPFADNLAEAVILIDPGHGGEDPGAISSDQSIMEKQATLATSLKLKELLEAKGATVLMTRTDDHYVELGERADQSNAERVDLFISLHYDGSEDPDLRGTTTYYFHESDYPIGRAVNERLAELESMPNNGINFGNYQVLRENHRPSILLELGYMTNPADVPQISSQAYYEAVAEKIVAGITDYFQSLS